MVTSALRNEQTYRYNSDVCFQKQEIGGAGRSSSSSQLVLFCFYTWWRGNGSRGQSDQIRDHVDRTRAGQSILFLRRFGRLNLPAKTAKRCVSRERGPARLTNQAPGDTSSICRPAYVSVYTYSAGGMSSEPGSELCDISPGHFFVGVSYRCCSRFRD